MIDITFQPTQLVMDQISPFSIKLTNSGDKPCTHVNFRLQLPIQIVLLEGTDKIENAKIDPGQNIILNVHVRPKRVGSWIIGSSSFSYRDSQGQSKHPSPLHQEIAVIPKELQRDLLETQIIEVDHSDEINQCFRDNQLITIQATKQHELVENRPIETYNENNERVNIVPAHAPRIFISYSHIDEKFMVRLVSMLKPLEKQGILEIWHDREIKPGNEWYQEIQNAINTCNLALLLISIDFLNSRFIQEDELPRLLQLRKEKGLRVIPIIVRHCTWTSIPILKDLQALPKDGRPVISFKGAGQPDRIWAEIVKKIEEIAKIS
jgi:hypothetical protein